MVGDRAAVTSVQAIIVVALIIVAGGAGAYFLNSGGSSSSGPVVKDMTLVESNPITQTDSFNPENVTVVHDTTVTLVIMNGDDEARTFEINSFNVNQTISSGSAARMTFTVGGPGTFEIYVPPAPAYEGYRASPSVVGYIIVT